ncbi:MAG: adenylate/guanylate cyclase domain-containing protein, partial [Chitinophagales bacterium]
FFIGLCIGIAEEWLLENRLHTKPFWQVTIVRVLLYISIIGFWLLSLNTLIIMYGFDMSMPVAFRSYIVEGTGVQDFTFAFFAALIAVSIFQIKKLHRKGDLWNFVLGKYNTPTEVERIFIFIDLKSSTTIAEKLGHLKYSHFLKDYFYDITEAILLTEGEIYQYVGDEIILTWKTPKGLKNANCLRCFYYMKKHIEGLKETYLQKYGYYPQFKAGLHGGTVVTTWMGELKKEIVFTGDVLNTTARIQEKCNELKQELLISGDLLQQLNLKGNFEATFVDKLQLRGKTKEVELYGITHLKKK